MNELATQSANGTNSTTDCKAIQDEIDQLTTEIDRVSETTKFNETYLLKGNSQTASKSTFMQSGYALKENTKFFRKGATADTEALSDADTKKAIASGERLYTAFGAANQTDAKVATKGKDYDYVTKLYDEKGKEVSAENILAGTMADGKTEATNGYFTSDAGLAGNDAEKNVKVAVDTAKKTDGNGYLQQFDVNGKLSFNLHVGDRKSTRLNSSHRL